MENKESFSYNYNAQQQREVEQIRSQYQPRQEDPMERLRKLHSGPSQKAQLWALTLGVVGVLLLGTGMSLIMTELGELLGSYCVAIGVGVGVLGMLMAALAYPVYERVLKAERKKIAPEILRLTDELLK